MKVCMMLFKRAAAAFLVTATALATGIPAAKADHYYGHYYRHHHGNGDAVAAGVIGLAAGALIGAAMAQPSSPRPRAGSRLIGRVGDGDHIAYCARRYRSYDAGSNTFIGNDGHLRQCR